MSSELVLKRWVVASIVLYTIVLLCVFVHTAQASTTHTYVCSNITLGADSTCTGGSSSLSLTIPNTNNSSAYDNAGTALNVNNATWYVTMTVSGTGTYNVTCSGSCSGGFTGTGSVTDHSATFSGTGSQGIDITNNGNSFNGTISYLCVSDTLGACTPPAPASPSVNRFANIFGDATSTASSTNLVIADIPNLDLFLGYAVFYSVVILCIWLLKS